MSAHTRFIGIDLGGARSVRTSLAILEAYPKERKIFLLDVNDRLSESSPKDGASTPVSETFQNYDILFLERLIASLPEREDMTTLLAVNAPLDLPPCIFCTRKHCPMPAKCTVKAVQFMRNQSQEKSSTLLAPYLHRPVEVWAKKHLLPGLPKEFRVEIEEALGSNRAPLASRYHFLKRHFPPHPTVEVWPKIALAQLGLLGIIPKKLLAQYRRLEDGADARVAILDTLIRKFDLFIYDRDQKNLSEHLSSFDAFVCAFTGYLSTQNCTEKRPKQFPKDSSWILIPNQNILKEIR